MSKNITKLIINSPWSLPFTPGEYQRVAVKIVDDRGIESLRVINIVPAEVG